jgi:hypothetical protein
MARFTKSLPLLVDQEMAALVGQAADQRMTSAASYVRQAIAAALIRDGYAKADAPESPRRRSA